MTYSDEKHIKHVMDNFDFDRIQSVMEFMNWKWFIGRNGVNDFLIPTVEDLKKTATRLLSDVAQQPPHCTISTGGFVVTKHDDWIELAFNLESIESYPLNLNKDYERIKLNKKRVNKIKQLNNLNEKYNSTI